MGNTSAKVNDKKCPHCGAEPHKHPEIKRSGNSVGNGPDLGAEIMKKYYGGGSAQDHPLSLKEKEDDDGMPYPTAQAHHLICTKAMSGDKTWGWICASFGYDINHETNGVMLPGDPRIACHCKIPIHKGNHDYAFDEKKNEIAYTQMVVDRISGVKGDADNGDFCKENITQVKEQLDNISQEIFGEVKGFTTKISSDGGHYEAKSSIGCSNHKKFSLKGKVEGLLEFTNLSNCSKPDRDHGFTLVEGTHYYKPR